MEHSFSKEMLTNFLKTESNSNGSILKNSSEFAKYFNSIGFEGSIYESYFVRALYYYFLLSNTIQGFIFVNNELIFRFGLEKINPDTIQETTEDLSTHIDNHKYPKFVSSYDFNGYSYNLFLHSVNVELNQFRLFFLIPNNESIQIYPVDMLSNLIRRYYLNLPGKNTIYLRPFFNDFEESIRNHIFSGTLPKQGIFSVFYIQNLDMYFQVLGDQLSREILDEIHQEIMKYLKKGDKIFRLGKRIVLTFSPNCGIDTVRKRFDDVFFQVKNLIIDYEMHFFQVEPEFFRIDKFWEFIIGIQQNK